MHTEGSPSCWKHCMQLPSHSSASKLYTVVTDMCMWLYAVWKQDEYWRNKSNYYVVGIISCVSHPQSKLSYHSFMVPCLQLKILIIWTSFSVQPTATKCLVVLHLSNSFCKLRHLWQSTKQSQVTGKIWWLKWEEGCVVKHEHSIHKCVHTVPNGSIVSSVHRYVCTMPQVLHVFMRGAILLTELSVVIFGLFFSESTSMYMYAVIHYHVCWSVGMVGVSEIQLEYMPWWWCKLYYYISVDIMQDNTT